MNAIHSEYKAIAADFAAWPDWARFLVMDSDGVWSYHASEPVVANLCWLSWGKEQIAPPRPLVDDWKDSVIRRPS